MRERERDMVEIAMENKLTSSLADGVKKTQELIALKNKLWSGIKKEEERKWDWRRTCLIVMKLPS